MLVTLHFKNTQFEERYGKRPKVTTKLLQFSGSDPKSTQSAPESSTATQPQPRRRRLRKMWRSGRNRAAPASTLTATAPASPLRTTRCGGTFPAASAPSRSAPPRCGRTGSTTASTASVSTPFSRPSSRFSVSSISTSARFSVSSSFVITFARCRWCAQHF